MRTGALVLVAGLLIGSSPGCSSSLQQPDGAGGTGATGTGGTAGTGGTTGTGGTSGGGACVVAGVTYPNGAEFPCTPGDCQPCGCMNGRVVVYTVDCHFDAGALCSIDQAYGYGDTGGLVAREDSTVLGPSLAYARTRTISSRLDGGSMTCAPMLPGCDSDSGAAVGVTRIMNDIDDADVQAALATSKEPLYGHDTRPVDGSVFQFLRIGDGAGFLVGAPCTTSGGCVDAPAGVARLVADLRALDAQQLMDPSCAELR
jgi:hypothetical protein